MREDENFQILPADPRRFMAVPLSRAGAILSILAAVAVTIIAVLVVIFFAKYDEGPEVVFVQSIGAALIPAGVWAITIYALWGIKKRRDFYEHYPRLVNSQITPIIGTVKNLDLNSDDNGTIEQCWLDVDLGQGNAIRVRTHRRRSNTDASGRSIRRKIHQAPQFGDQIAVFYDPQSVLPPLALTTRAVA